MDFNDIEAGDIILWDPYVGHVKQRTDNRIMVHWANNETRVYEIKTLAQFAIKKVSVSSLSEFMYREKWSVCP